MCGLHSIRDNEREIDRSVSETQHLEEFPSCSGEAGSVLQVSATSGEGEGWTLVTSGTKRKAPAPPKVLKL